MRVKVFLIAPTGMVRRSLRRYSRANPCPEPRGYHDAIVALDVVPDDGSPIGDHWPHEDPRWPTHCGCGYGFADSDEWQLFSLHEYRDPAGNTCTLRDAPVGAVWDATWMPDWRTGPDGRSLTVKLPGGHDWLIDGRASNCTMPGDKEHRCWVRHGRPEDGTLHVDKNGLTCAAGAGSIAIPGWHGFLHHGELYEG